jgi:hypothetical protein
MLPPWGRSVIFVDWHGVLSRDLFWTSILNSPMHPLRPRLEIELAEIFARDQPTAHDWMKGRLSSADIIAAMRLAIPARYRQDYLARQLGEDFHGMIINTGLVELLGRFRPDAFVVLATDNMDCFADAVGRIYDRRDRRDRPTRPRRLRHTPRRPASPVSQFAACVAGCDDLLCSSEVGALKSEDPRTFFAPWLDQHDLTFADAILIDDRADNCAAFAEQGGTALRWKLGTDPLGHLEEPLNRWFLLTGSSPVQHA